MSKRPARSPNKTPPPLENRIVALRLDLVAAGFDAGPASIAARLRLAGKKPPAISTIRRILHKHQLIVPQPKKRPRNSYIRFEAAQPNETWQSDFTHWQLEDGTHVEILNFLDDHSRFLLGCRAFIPVTGQNVVDLFLELVTEFDPPQSTLTDNGRVFTARFGNGKNKFEYTLADLGILQKNSSPNYPQTHGKVERFQQTLKKWLAKQLPVHTLDQLQTQIDTFRDYYNRQRPHRSLGRKTPDERYSATAKIGPHGTVGGHWRIRDDVINSNGTITLLYGGKLHHIGLGRSLHGTPVRVLIHDRSIRIIHRTTGDLIRALELDPTRNYQPQNT